MSKPRIILSHPTGNENSRSAAISFHEAEMLNSFHTSIACFENDFLYKISQCTIFKDLRRRLFDTRLKAKTHSHPYKEIGRQIAIKLNYKSLTTHDIGFFCVDKVYQYLDRCVAHYIRKHNNSLDAVYTYEDCALQTFTEAKRNKKICLYDLPTIYWRAKRNLLNEERTKNPEWAITLDTFNDSDIKLQRKDAELALSDRIYVASSFTKKTLASCPAQLADIEVIPYGFPSINEQRIYPTFDGRKIKALFVGRLSQGKGLSYLFEALKGLEDKIELTIVGKGNIDKCSVMKNALKKVNYIPSLPHQEILSLMATHDLFVFPSLCEGFGLVITEAMSQGTPVITTERTCGPDIITHGKDGWIIKAGSAEPLKDLFNNFINKPYLLQIAGRNALQTASQRPWSCYEKELTNSINIFLDGKKLQPKCDNQ